MTPTTAPTPKVIRQLLYDYALPRWAAARMLGCALVTLHRYCLPVTSKHHHDMPQYRWERLLEQIKVRGPIRYRRGSWRFSTRAHRAAA